MFSLIIFIVVVILVQFVVVRLGELIFTRSKQNKRGASFRLYINNSFVGEFQGREIDLFFDKLVAESHKRISYFFKERVVKITVD